MPAAADNETLVLPPFEVDTSKDQGFIATSALAGGRLNTALKDTPVAYSVLTKEFLDAFNVNDLTEAVQWSVNTTFNPGNFTDQGFGFSPAINITMRGAAPSESNYPMRNFFPYNSNTDSYALDRFDFARGPNAILFGAAQFGGTPSAVTKRALTGKAIRQVQLQFGSWDHVRATLDVNQPINSVAAIRAAAMWDNGDTWRDYEWKRKKGLFLTTTYNLTPATTLRAEGEYTEAQAKIFPTSLSDQVSAWDGKTTFAGSVLPANAPSAATLAANGVAYGTNNANPLMSPLWVYDPSGFGTSNVLNFANTFRTKGAAGNSTAANANYIGGKQIVNSSVSFAGQPMLYGYDVPSGRYDTDLAGSPYFSVPSQKTTNLWTSGKPTQAQVGKDFQLTLNHQLGDSLFFEIAGDTNKVQVDGNNAVNRGLNTEYIDINQTLPNGATNPYFKHPYTEFWTYQNLRWYELRSARAQAAYVKEASWGKLQFGLIGGVNYQRQEKRSYLYLLPLPTFGGSDARFLDASQGSTALWNRLYLDQGGRDFYNTNLGPMTLVNPDGTTTTATPTWVLDASRKDNSASNITKFKFAQAATNLSLFKNHLVLIGAVRRDLTTLITRNTLNPGDYPTGWDGHNIIFKPDAPADWASLTYIPKDANGNPTGPAQPADTRPRLSVPATATLASSNILPAPQYAKDRFRDDYNPPQLGVGVNTYSFGGTLNITRWLGAYANASTTFNPNLLIQRIDETLLKPTSAHGTDFGLRINPDSRISISLGFFNSYQKNTPVNAPSGYVTDYNNIWSSPVVGDLSASGMNNHNIPLIPSVVRDTQTQQSHGVEFETTANLTRSWRLLFNAAYTRAWQSNAFPDSVAYSASHDAVARQVLKDSGVLISSTNVASIDPTLNDPTKINVAAVGRAVTAWNALQTAVFPNMVTGRQKLAGSVEQTANLGTDYTFHEGMLKGLSVGGGLHYRGRMVVGYRGSDTIVNPSNPTQAIDDPTVDGYTTVFSKPYTTADGRLGYTWRFEHGHTLQLNLNISNLFNRRTPVYFLDAPGAQATNTILRPRNGDVTSPAVETVPAGYSFLNPISFTLGATLNF